MTLELVINIIACVALIVTLLVAYYAFLIYKAEQRYKDIPGPQAKGLFGFFFGHLVDMTKADEKGIILPQYFADLTKIYGPTLKYRIFHWVIVFTIDPKLMKEIYIVDENFPKPTWEYNMNGFPGGERFLGKGLVTEINHDKWKFRRALFNAGFHRQMLLSFVETFNSKADILIEFLKTKADGKTCVTLFDHFNHAALDIIASVAFGMDIGSVNNPEQEFNTYANEAIDGINAYYVDPFIKLKPHKWPFILRHRNTIRFLRKICYKQIEERLSMIKNNQELPNDMLTSILKSHENEEFDLELMVDDFVTFIVAGQESTSSLLASLFLELGRNSFAFQKLKEEIDSVIGTNGEIKPEHLPHLKYTSCCVKEILRLWPTDIQLSRWSTKDMITKDFIIPKDSWLNTSTYASGRCEKHFANPLEFKPERFIKEINTENNGFSYVYAPFSLGPRNCIGQKFTQIEVKVLIAKFVQNFDLKLDLTQSFMGAVVGTLRPRDGTRCYLTRRR